MGRIRVRSKKMRKSKKDFHDYLNIYGMLILTGVIAFSAFFRIPAKIEKISTNEWDEFYYREAMKWKNTEIVGNLEVEMMKQCTKISINSDVILEDAYIKCKNKDKKLDILIKKDVSGSCFWKIQGEC